MRNITIVVNALNFTADMLDFAVGIAKESGASLTGLFIHDSRTIGDVPEVKLYAGQVYVEEIVLNPEEHNEIVAKINKNVRLFTDSCKERNISYEVQQERGIPLDTTIRASRYADLIIALPTLSFEDETDVPTKFVEDILTKSECPVLLSPEKHTSIEEVIIAFDGSRSSAFAMKQFYYQLPFLNAKAITILTINEPGEEDIVSEDNVFFNQWVAQHCPRASHISLVGNAKDVLFNYFMENDDNADKMLVAGAFGRSVVSRFFTPGTTDLILKTIDMPIFIAHN